MTFRRLSISAMVLAVVCVPVSATTIVYCSTSDCGVDNQTAFNNAATAENLTFPNAPILFVTAGLSADTTEYTDSGSGTTFLDENGAGTAIGVGFSGPPLTSGLPLFNDGDSIQITLPANVYAFGTDLQGTSTGGICVETTSTFSSNGCSVKVFPPSNNASEFIGVVSTSPITTVWLAAPNTGIITLNDFEIGEQSQSPPSDTPEVATMLMIGTGLISLGVMRRRSRTAC